MLHPGNHTTSIWSTTVSDTYLRGQQKRSPPSLADVQLWVKTGEDLSSRSYWSICRACVLVLCLLCWVGFSGQWEAALHSHRSVAGWCPGRCLCDWEKGAGVNAAQQPDSEQTPSTHYSTHSWCSMRSRIQWFTVNLCNSDHRHHQLLSNKFVGIWGRS